MVVVTDLWLFQIVLLDRVAVKLTLVRFLIFLSILVTYACHRSIRLELFHDCSLLLHNGLQKLGQCIFPDRQYCQLIVIAKSKAEDNRGGGHFLLLGVRYLLCLEI